MFNYNKLEIIALAKENGFRSETLEKVLRLVDILNFINTNDKLSPYLILKGGTSINFTIFNLPRLSVDIDLDFSSNCTKTEMLEKREEITAVLRRYMETNDYIFSNGTKNRHALDSFVFSYFNNFGNKDHLKIEINYMNRVHIYEPVTRNVEISFLSSFKVLTLNKYEVFGSKIKALLERCTVRDIYDVYHMLDIKLFSEEEYILIKKCAIFYMAIGKTTDRPFCEVLSDFFLTIDNFMVDRIPQYLSSTLRNSDTFDMKNAVNTIRDFIKGLMLLTNDENKFLKEFDNGNYTPSLLFNETDIIDRIHNHPMALWKIASK